MATLEGAATHDNSRDAILEAALQCFVAEGYAATAMSTIAARLGRSKGGLYRHFKSKEELFEVLLRRCCARMGKQMDIVLCEGDEGDLRAILINIAGTFLDHILGPEMIAIHRLVIGEGARFPDLARLFYEVGPKIGNARDREFLQRMMDAGLLQKCDPAQSAEVFKGLVLSGWYELRLWGVIADLSAAERKRHAEAAVDTFLRAFAPD